MPKVIVEESTFLKKQLLGSQDLADSEKIFVSKGSEFLVTKYAPDRNQHLYLVLASPKMAQDDKTKLQEVYAYDPHIRVEGEELQRLMKLMVAYRSQLNNDPSIFGAGWRQCNITSNTMLADYLLGGEVSKTARNKGHSEPESFYMRLVAKYGDTIYHEVHTKALKDLGIESYFSYKLSVDDVLTSLSKNIPVVVGFAYKGSGHICLVVGHDPAKKQWLVHDPYGTRHGASDSYDVGIGGAFDPYSYDVFQRIFLDYGGKDSGWGRIVTSIKGKPTGLPASL